MTKRKICLRVLNIFIWIALLALLIFYLNTEFKQFRFPSGKGLGSTLFIYIATILPFIGLGIWVVLKYRNSRTTWIALTLFVLSYLIRILLADFISPDYTYYLSKWINKYRSFSIQDCFIVQVGNYAPFYNYFLILFSRLPIYDLYLIKTLSFYFEVVTAIIIMKLIAVVKQTKSNPVHLAIALILLIPLINTSQWGQCDIIYTCFAIAGIYFAVCHQSVWCFVMMGLGVALKIQMVFIFPLVLILLICKNSKGEKYLYWKHIWFTALAFVIINLVPLFFGGSILKVFRVYLDQITVGNPSQALCANCANVFLWLSEITRADILYPVLTFLFLGIVSLMLLFIIILVIKNKRYCLEIKDVLFLAAFIPLIVVFFMPKMNDRYFYMAEMFMFIYMMVSDSKKITCTAYITFEYGVLITYFFYLFKLKFIYEWANIFTGITVVLMIFYFFKTFKKKSKSKLNELNIEY